MQKEEESGAALMMRARSFMEKAFEGKFRLDKITPMAQHSIEVAEFVLVASGTPAEVASAYLHDVVENSELTIEDIREGFGDKIAKMVDGLTDPPELKSLTSLDKKTAQATRIRNKSNGVKKVRMADMISNLRSLAVSPPESWSDIKRLGYIEGCRRIAFECGGLNEYLDTKFVGAYDDAFKKCSPPPRRL